ncbi:MAG: 4Fe-4S dicluster domain-containing protein, partial [Endomicrobiia bacterium]
KINTFGSEPGHSFLLMNNFLFEVEELLGGESIRKIFGKKPEEIKNKKFWNYYHQILSIFLINVSIFWSVDKIILGGPMMGIAQGVLDVPVIKGTSGILVQELKNLSHFSDYGPCIHCGRCIDVCPMNLMPNFLSYYSEHMLWEKCKEYFPNDCIECGCCAYECPAKRPIVQQIKLAKFNLSKQ